MPAVEPLSKTMQQGKATSAKKSNVQKPVKPRAAKRASLLTDPDQPHACSSCGCVYPKQQGYFPKIVIKNYKGNNYFAHMCNTCLEQRYQAYLKSYDDEPKALRRCCELLDVYYDPELGGRSFDGITGYIAELSKRYKGYTMKTWDNTLSEQADVVDSLINDPSAYADGSNPDVREGIEVFGEGFPADAYTMMLRTYHGYIDPLGDTATAGQLKSARFLAALEYRCMEAIKADKPNASALSSSLTKAIKESGFDTVQEQNNGAADEDTFGQWLERIEMYTPAQYVKQTPYKDVDNLGEYYDRFVRRPIENLLSRASQMQTDELFITDEEVDAADTGDGDDDA